MIRVAKPGSLLLIADETEKHVKGVYEKGPGGYLYKNRKAPVSAPVDLVPPRCWRSISKLENRRMVHCSPSASRFRPRIEP